MDRVKGARNVKLNLIKGFMRKNPPEISIEWLDVNIEIKVNIGLFVFVSLLAKHELRISNKLLQNINIMMAVLVFISF